MGLRSISLKYTPFGELKEGDEFVRVGALPVLVSDLHGKRSVTHFTPIGFGDGRPLEIFVMVNVGSHLRELSECDELRYISPQPEWDEGEAPDSITEISGGFTDGYGADHTEPTYCLGAVCVNGLWYWRIG